MDNQTSSNLPAPPPGFSYDPAAGMPPPDGTSAAPAGPDAAVLTRPAPPPGFSYEPVNAPQPQLKRTGYSMLDPVKELGAGALEGAGSLVSGAGSFGQMVARPITAAVNDIAGRPVLSAPINAFKPIGDAVSGLGQKLRGTESAEAQTADAQPLVEGSVLKPSSLRLGAGAASPMAWVQGGANLVGQAIPMLLGGAEAKGMKLAPELAAKVAGDEALTAVEQGTVQAASRAAARKTLGTGAAIGGLQGAQGSADVESSRIGSMAPDQLAALPGYQSRIAAGMTPDAARADLASTASQNAFAATLPVATMAGVAGSVPFLQRAQQTLAESAGSSLLKRMGASAALEAPVQGGIGVAQQAAQTAAANDTTGENRSLTENSASAFGSGALAGGAFGAFGAVLHRVPHPDAAPGSLSDVVNTQAEQAAREAAPAAEPTPAAIAAAPAAAPTARANPGAPPWMDASTGEVPAPSRAQLIDALSNHMLDQRQLNGSLRIDPQAVAQAWGVPQSDVAQARTKATQMAQDKLAEAERGALNGPAAGQDAAASAGADAAPGSAAAGATSDVGAAPAPTDTTTSVPFMITQGMKSELRALGHSDAAISAMTPDQAHATLQAGERVLGPARDLLGRTQPAADEAAQQQPALNEPSGDTGQLPPSGAANGNERLPGTGAAAPDAADTAPAGTADAQPAADAAAQPGAAGGGSAQPDGAVRHDLAGAGDAAVAAAALKPGDAGYDPTAKDHVTAPSPTGDPTEPLHPWSPVDASKSVTYAGGKSANGRETFIDKHVPRTVEAGGQTIDAHEAISLHEDVEGTLLHNTRKWSKADLNMLAQRSGMESRKDLPIEVQRRLKAGKAVAYVPAHTVATRAENHFVARKYGIDPELYQSALADGIATARKKGETATDMPSTLDSKPYDNMGESALAKGVGAEAVDEAPQASETSTTVAKEPTRAQKPDRVQAAPAAESRGAGLAAGAGSTDAQGHGGAGETGKGKAPAQEAAAPRADRPAPETAEPAQPVTSPKTPPTGGVSASGAAEADRFQVSDAAKAAERVRVQSENGEMTGRARVDKLVANGFTKVESVPAGNRMLHKMVRADGSKESIPAGALRYAEEVTAKAAEKKASSLESKQAALSAPKADKAPATGKESLPVGEPASKPDAPTAEEKAAVEALRGEIGWDQIGGRLLRAGDTGREKPEVTGRTTWESKTGPNGETDFWRRRPEQGGKINETDARAALTKFAEGQPLKAREQRFIEYARREAAAREAAFESQIAEFHQDQADASAADMAAAREALQHEGIAPADTEEALTLEQLVNRAYDAGADPKDVLDATFDGTSAEKSRRLWDLTRQLEERHATDQRAGTESRPHGDEASRAGSAAADPQPQGFGLESDRQAAAAPEAVKAQAGLFAEPTARERVKAATESKDVQRNGLGRDLVRPEQGDGELLAGKKPAQEAISATAADEAPAKPSANTKDAGEELWANRRNSTGKGIDWNDIADLNATLKAREAVKSKVWPRPDYAALVEGGMPAPIAHVIKQVYDALGVKPQTSAPTDQHYQTYLAAVQNTRDAVFAWAKQGMEKTDGMPAEAKATAAAIAAKHHASGDAAAALVSALRLGNARIDPILDAVFPMPPGEVGTVSRFRTGKQGAANNALAHLLGGNKVVRALQVRERNLRAASLAAEKGWPAAQEAWEKSFAIHETKAGEKVYKNGVDRVTTAPEFWVSRKVGTGLRRIIADGFTTREQAVEAAKTAYAQARKSGGDGAKAEAPVELQNARSGPPRRGANEDVSSDQLRETFGFKGINFGNWMKGDGAKLLAERQAHLNHAYDAFHDLAQIMGLPPRAMSLDGMLGIAVGAQGTGGKKAAAAHFVPGINEINLTREQGAGSLAHEWAHALDHYFAAKAGPKVAAGKDPFLTEHLDRPIEGVRPEVVAAFKTIVNAMKSRPETDAERATRLADYQKRARTGVETSLSRAREELQQSSKGETAAALAQFDELAQRLRVGDVGDGYLKTGSGKMDAAPQVVAQLANLVKETTGRKPEWTQGLAANARAVHEALGAKSDNAERAVRVPSDYSREARKLEGNRSKPYWTTKLEMFARAFQSYVLDKLAIEGHRNSYLTRDQMDPATLKAAQEMGVGEAGDRYPRATERATINKAFDTLVGDLKAETRDDGRVALFSFAGESAKTADRGKLVQAQQMEAAGRDSVPDRFGNQPGSPEDTHMATGWHRGADGKWRWEIDDSAASIKAADAGSANDWRTRARSGHAMLDQVLDHPQLFDAYPELKQQKVAIDQDMSARGSYDPKTKTIRLNDSLLSEPHDGADGLKSTLLHEVQHVIQTREGFARGGNIADARSLPEFQQMLAEKSAAGFTDAEKRAAFEVYRRLAGETEARNTQKRMDMTAADRAAIPPTETADVARGDQIVRFNDKPAEDMRVADDQLTPAQQKHTDRIQQIAEAAMGKWQGDDKPELKVVATPEQLPTFARRGEDGQPSADYKRAAGMYDGKTIYIVASSHATDAAGMRKILTTMAHEGIGHYGVDRIISRELGPDAWSKVEAATERLRANPGDASPRMREVLADVQRRYGAVDPTTFAREFLAVSAERGVKNGLLDRAIAAVRSFIRRVLPDLHLSEHELRQLLVKSDEYLQRGETYRQRVQATQAMSFSRDGWNKDFPDAITALPHGELANHPDYAAAKAGDPAAALRLARDVVTPEFVDKVRAAIPAGSDPLIVPVVAREAGGENDIPRMAAEVLAQRMGLKADSEITQVDKVSRGGSDAMHRLANQPAFEGKVEAGQNYVLLDDTLAQGGTLAQLKTHIEREGGHVLLATSLTAKDYSRKLALDPNTLRQMRGRFGSIEDWWKQQFGHGFDGLTESEARAALTYDKGRLSPDALRNRVTAGKIPEIGRVGEAAAGDRPGAEAPGPGGRNADGVTTKPPRADFSKSDPEDTNDRGEPDTPNRPRKPFSKASASIESMQEVLPKLDDSAFARAKEWAKGKLLDAEPHLLGVLQLRHVLELASEDKVLAKPAKEYAGLFQRMDGDRNAMTMEGAAKSEKLNKFAFEHGPGGWAGKLTAEAKNLFKFMHEVTQIAVDPTNQYERLLMRDSRGEQTPWSPDLVKERIKALREQMRGRSGDDKTPMMDEIKDLRKLPAREKVRAQKYPELVAKWNALSPEARDMFTMMREHYQQTSDNLQEATLARIQALDIPEANKRAATDYVRRNFDDQKVGGVYFPLQRFGDYWIASQSPDVGQGDNAAGGEYHFTKYENAAQAMRAERQLRAAGHTIEATGKQNKDYATQKPVTGTFMGQLTAMLKAGHAPDKVLDDIHQMFLRTLPELSLRKHGIHRSNVAGYTDNVPRVFASNVLHGAHQIAKARFGYQLENTLEQMKERLEGKRFQMGVGAAAHADALLGELAKRHQWIMNPTNSKLATMVNSVGFAYYLAASPASAVVNLSQGPMITLPVLGARHGWPAAMKELGAATRDAMRTGGNLRRTLTDDAEKRAFDTLEANGTFARTATHSLGGIAEGDALKMSPAHTKVMTAMGYLFQKAEVINREAAGMAAFRLATKDGKSFQDAVHYADEIVNGTHFDYSNANRARYMQGNVQKVLFQFKNYALGMSWVMYRNLEQSLRGETPEIRRVARRTLTGILGMTSLFAGVMGTPINSLLSAGANAYHAATGNDDEPWDFNTEFRQWLNEHLGETAGSLIADGAVNKLGVNVASRLGTGDLWFRDADRQLEGGAAYDQALESLAGPIGAMTKNMFVGTQQINSGHTERGIETIMPTFIKNAMKSVRYASQGVNSLRGDPIVHDVSGPEQLIQALGFQPTKIANQQRENTSLMNYSKFIMDRRQNLMNAYAMAQQAGDEETRAAALQRIAAFNQTNPEVRISMITLRDSLRQRARMSQMADNGIVLNRKIAARVRSEVGVQPGE